MSRKIKVITAAIVVTVLIWLWAMPFGAIEIKRCYGDVNNDAYVTTEDARIALMVAAGIYEHELFGLDYEGKRSKLFLLIVVLCRLHLQCQKFC